MHGVVVDIFRYELGYELESADSLSRSNEFVKLQKTSILEKWHCVMYHQFATHKLAFVYLNNGVFHNITLGM